MDDRQTEIRQGEGLTESRVNQDFIDFLNKWSTPVLMVLAVAALAWAGLQQLEKRKIAKVNQAFADLDAAMSGSNPSPDSLKTLATEYKGVRSVPELALLKTTDLYLSAFITGVEPGAELDTATGQPVDENDLLNDDQRTAYLNHAGQLAQQVIDLTSEKDGKSILAVQAMIRLAVVNEGKRDFAGAKTIYSNAAQVAEDAGYPTLAAFASKRAEETEGLAEIPGLPAAEDLSILPGEEPIDLDVINNLINQTPGVVESGTGTSADDQSVEQVPEVPAEDAEEAAEETEPAADPESESP